MREKEFSRSAGLDANGVMALNRAVGLLLRRARENQALPQQYVADKCGMSNSVVCRLESATREPRLAQLVMLCLVLGVRLSDVIRAAEDEAFPLDPVPWSGRSAELIRRPAGGEAVQQ